MKQFPTVPQVQAFFSQHDLDGIDPESFLESLRLANGKEPKVTRSPQVGDTVLFKANPDDSISHSNWNKDRIPAIITRKWSDYCVNIKIIPDCGPMQDRTSVVHQSINAAGYNFIYPGEAENYINLDFNKDSTNENVEVKDASSFLKQEQQDK